MLLRGGQRPLGRFGSDRDERTERGARAGRPRSRRGSISTSLAATRAPPSASTQAAAASARTSGLPFSTSRARRGTRGREPASAILQRDLGRALERRLELLVAVALLQLARDAKRAERLGRRPRRRPGRAAPRARGTSRPDRSTPPASCQCSLRRSRDHRHEARRHGDDDRGGRACLRGRASARRASRGSSRSGASSRSSATMPGRLSAG